MKVILIVGRIRAGKDTVVIKLKELLSPRRTKVMSFSDALGSVLDIFDVPHERQYFHEFATVLKATSLGRDILNRAVAKELRELNEGGVDIVLLCGARFIENLEVVRGYRHFAVSIEAQLEVRYRREKKKNPKLTLEEFERTDRSHSKGNIGELMNRASVVIKNNGTLSQLKAKLHPVAQQIMEL